MAMKTRTCFSPNSKTRCRRVRPVLPRYGIALLEVIFSLGLLVFAMAVVGTQINVALKAARETDIATRALMLADTKLEELQAGVLLTSSPNDEVTRDDELDGDFGILYPGFSWQVRMEYEPNQSENLLMVTLNIGYNESQVRDQIDDPEYEIDFEDEGRRTIQTVYALLPVPAKIVLERDLPDVPGYIQNMMAGAGGLGGGQAGTGTGAGAGAGGGAGAGAADLSAQALSEFGDLLPDFLTNPDGFDPRMLSSLAGEDFLVVVDLIESLVRGEVDENSLAELLRNESIKQMLLEAGRGEGI